MSHSIIAVVVVIYNNNSKAMKRQEPQTARGIGLHTLERKVQENGGVKPGMATSVAARTQTNKLRYSARTRMHLLRQTQT